MKDAVYARIARELDLLARRISEHVTESSNISEITNLLGAMAAGFADCRVVSANVLAEDLWQKRDPAAIEAEIRRRLALSISGEVRSTIEQYVPEIMRFRQDMTVATDVEHGPKVKYHSASAALLVIPLFGLKKE